MSTIRNERLSIIAAMGDIDNSQQCVSPDKIGLKQDKSSRKI